MVQNCRLYRRWAEELNVTAKSPGFGTLISKRGVAQFVALQVVEQVACPAQVASRQVGPMHEGLAQVGLGSPPQVGI